MSQSYYIAFVVDQDIAERGTVIVEAGVDLLAGPYPSEDAAARALRDTCVQHRRLAAFAGLAQFLCRDSATPPVRIEVISVSIARLARYNARHPQQAQADHAADDVDDAVDRADFVEVHVFDRRAVDLGLGAAQPAEDRQAPLDVRYRERRSP